MSDFVVEPWVLTEAAVQWREQSAQVTTAGTRVGGASTSGFSDGVISTAGSFTTAWASIIGDLATAANGVSDQIDAASVAYMTADVQAQQDFEDWLMAELP